MSSRIYVVDDEPLLVETLVRALERLGHSVRPFGRADDLLDALLENPPDLVLSDIRMPGHDGLWLLERVVQSTPDVGVLLMSAINDLHLAVNCMKQGAMDYLVKPFALDVMAVAIQKASEKQALIRENREHRRLLEARTAELRGSLASVNQLLHSSIGMLIRALDWRERETRNHSLRVARYAMSIGNEMGLDRNAMRRLLVGGILHDVGKIGIPDNILLKPGPLEGEEWLMMRRHPEIGHDILSDTRFIQDAADIVLCHHERFDGQGYPHGLRGTEIPLDARIFSIADTLDAMTNDRPYRQALSFEAAQTEIRQWVGSQFDAEVVDAYLGVELSELTFIQECTEEEVWHLLDVALVGPGRPDLLSW